MKDYILQILFLVTSCLYFGHVFFVPSQKCDCSGGTVFVLDQDARISVYRTANALIESGDTLSGNILKQVLISQ